MTAEEWFLPSQPVLLPSDATVERWKDSKGLEWCREVALGDSKTAIDFMYRCDVVYLFELVVFLAILTPISVSSLSTLSFVPPGIVVVLPQRVSTCTM